MQGGDLSYTDMGKILVVVVAEIMLWEIIKQVIARAAKRSRSFRRLFLKTTNNNASQPTSTYGLDSSATQFGSSVWTATTSGQKFHTIGSCSRLSISPDRQGVQGLLQLLEEARLGLVSCNNLSPGSQWQLCDRIDHLMVLVTRSRQRS